MLANEIQQLFGTNNIKANDIIIQPTNKNIAKCSLFMPTQSLEIEANYDLPFCILESFI